MKRRAPIPPSPKDDRFARRTIDAHGDGAWLLTSQGALVHAGSHTAVIADLHLGYEWARGRQGDLLPAHSLEQTHARLKALFETLPIRRVVIAGDFFESRRPCLRARKEAEALASWIDRQGVDLVALRGNHDPENTLAGSTLVLAGWTIHHGDQARSCDRMIIGHIHPAVLLAGVKAPCFLVSDRCVVLPAFSDDAAGVNMIRHALTAPLVDHRFRCVAISNEALFDFGPLDDLRAAL